MEQLQRENEKLDGQAPDPHQSGGAGGDQRADRLREFVKAPVRVFRFSENDVLAGVHYIDLPRPHVVVVWVPRLALRFLVQLIERHILRGRLRLYEGSKKGLDHRSHELGLCVAPELEQRLDHLREITHALVSWLLSGDCIGIIKQYKTTRLLPYSLRVHLIEADRIATPTGSGLGTSLLYTTGKNPDNGNTIYDGVEVDKALRRSLCFSGARFPADKGPSFCRTSFSSPPCL